jgi:hypothetical protein
MSEDRRTEPRIPAQSLGLIANDSLAGTTIGSVADLSRGGLMMIGTSQAEAGGTLQLSVTRVDTPEQPVLEMVVRIAWKNAAATPGTEWIGAQITDISEPYSEILSGLLDEASAAGS